MEFSNPLVMESVKTRIQVSIKMILKAIMIDQIAKLCPNENKSGCKNSSNESFKKLQEQNFLNTFLDKMIILGSETTRLYPFISQIQNLQKATPQPNSSNFKRLNKSTCKSMRLLLQHNFLQNQNHKDSNNNQHKMLEYFL